MKKEEKKYIYINKDYVESGIKVINKSNCKQDEEVWKEVKCDDEGYITEFYEQISNYKNSQFILVDNKIIKDEKIILEEYDEVVSNESLMKTLTRTMIVNEMVLPQELEDYAKDTSGEDVKDFQHKESYTCGEVVKYKGKEYIQKKAIYNANDTSRFPSNDTDVWEKLN